MESDFDIDVLIFGEKVCNKCGEKKPRNSEHFQRDNNNPDGLRAVCKECMRVPRG